MAVHFIVFDYLCCYGVIYRDQENAEEGSGNMMGKAGDAASKARETVNTEAMGIYFLFN